MTTLIKNILLIDGFGRPPVRANVLIRDDKIMAIGSFPKYKADIIINGNESYLTPGFIDTDITSDRYFTLFSDPLHKNFLIQGVTSGMLGQCGFSLAPHLYGIGDIFFDWAFSTNANINWKTTKEFLQSISEMRTGINLGTLVGHGTLREEIARTGKEGFRKLTVKELRIFRMLIKRSIMEGAFGVSTGLGHYQFSETPYHEIRAVLDIVKNFNGVYTTHLRNEKDNLLNSVDETIRITKELNINTIITHLRPFLGFEDSYKKSLERISVASTNSNIYFNTNPFSSSAVLISDLLPEKFKNEDKNVLLEKMKDKKIIREISKSMFKIDAKNTIILNVHKMPFLSGKSLYEFASGRSLTPAMAIIQLMYISKFKTTILYENLNNKLVKESVLHDKALVSTSSYSYDGVDKKSDVSVLKRIRNTFPKFLKIADNSGINIEIAIEKITKMPAKIFNIYNRGIIVNGAFADMTIINKDLEITNVFVNGNMIYHDGTFENITKHTARALKIYKK